MDKKKNVLNPFKRIEKEQEDVTRTELLEFSNDTTEYYERYEPSITQGLNEEQVSSRKQEGLTNYVKRTNSKTYSQIFINNICTFFNIICAVIAVALVLVNSFSELTFLIILTINTVIGIIQEIKAKKTIDSLSIMTAPTASLIRNSTSIEVPVDDIVLDDIIKLKIGKQVPCDAIIKDGHVEVNESLLTGESQNIKKGPGDSLLCGSYITSGSCTIKAEKVGKNCYIQKLQSKAKRYSKPRSELLKSLKYITLFITIFLIPIGTLVAIRNYSAAKDAVNDPSFDITGKFNVYAIDSHSISSNPYELNTKIKAADGNNTNIITINFWDDDNFSFGSSINQDNITRFKIIYDSKAKGNVCISKIEVRELEKVTTEGHDVYNVTTDPNKTYTYTFGLDGNQKPLEFPEVKVATSYYSDGSLKFDSTSDNAIVDLSTTEPFQITLYIESRAYDPIDEKALMDNEILRITVTKTAGSIVGMIPAGLFLLVTIALAVSVIRLGKEKALVQELYCIEMLARVDCLCIDKTGTITDGTMNVHNVVKISDKFNIDEIMSNYLGALDDNNVTSIALQQHFGTAFNKKKLVMLPFSSERKLSAVSFKDIGTFILGAPEFVLPEVSQDVSNTVQQYSSMGYRVLMLAHTNGMIESGVIPHSKEPIGLIIMSDHIRDDSYETIKWFQENGVEIKVISGDNPYTVSEIAKKVNIIGAENAISLEDLTPAEIEAIAASNTVFGRVLPEQKALLIRALKAKGKTVAMIGDGVNDILAMKASDCSIAMASGSEAARNVSHLVLLDSSFACMPKVVFEGRRVINNIQRSASLYLMKTLLTMFITIISILGLNSLFQNVGYPFTPRNFLPLEMLIIGLPSYVLALQPNKDKINGNFMKNVLINSFTASLCLLLPVLLAFFIRYEYRNGSEFFASFARFGEAQYVSSFAALTIVWVGYALVVNLCRPFNKLKGIALIVIFGLLMLVSCSPILLETLFGITVSFKTLGAVDILLMVCIVLLSSIISRFFNDLVYQIKVDNIKIIKQTKYK